MKTKNTMKNDWIIYGTMGLIILLFAYTAASKLIAMDTFIFQMKLSPAPYMRQLAPVLGWVVPILELGICILFFLGGRWPKIGLYAAGLLMATFEVYIAAMLLSGLDLPCACGGIISRMDWKTHVVFNAAVMLFIALAIGLQRSKRNPEVHGRGKGGLGMASRGKHADN